MILRMIPTMIKSLKLASMSAMVTSVLLTQAEVVSVFQPEAQPAPRRVVRTQPAQAGTPQPVTTESATPAGAAQAQNSKTLPIFTPASPDATVQLQRAAEMLGKMEMEMAQGNQKLLNQLGQARLATGDQRDQRFADVLQGMLQQQEQLRKYLVDLRMTVTGNQGTMQTTTQEQQGTQTTPATTTGGGTTDTSPRR